MSLGVWLVTSLSHHRNSNPSVRVEGEVLRVLYPLPRSSVETSNEMVPVFGVRATLSRWPVEFVAERQSGSSS